VVYRIPALRGNRETIKTMENFQPIRHVPPDTWVNKVLFYARVIIDFQVNTVYRHMKKFLPRLQGTIVDIGAGDGPYRHLVNGATAQYHAVDSRDACLFGYSRSSAERFDKDRIPFESASVDHVICTEVLEHLVDPQPLIAEIHRILRPGGTGAVTVPWSARFHYIPHDYHRFTPTSLARCFSAFSSVDIEPRGTDITVIAAKILVVWFRLFRPDKKRMLLVTLPLAFVLAPCMGLAVMVGHLSLAIPFGSSDDPLGYTVWVRK
jgi:ubiquinone/menaquinone biosynthesis C-methylase UbiE